jgi:hypothetical protein
MDRKRSSQKPASKPEDITNPERVNCPSDETVRAVAYGEQPTSDSFQAHLDSCPACRREFLDHKAQLEWRRFYRKTSWLLYVVLFVIFCNIVFRACHASH